MKRERLHLSQRQCIETGRDLIQRLADSVELLLLMRNGLTPLVITEAALDEARAYLASPLPAATDCPLN